MRHHHLNMLLYYSIVSTMASHFEVIDIINYTVRNLLLEIEYEYSNKKQLKKYYTYN